MAATPPPDERSRDDDTRAVFSRLAEHSLSGVTHSISLALDMLSAEPEGQPLTPEQRALVHTANVAAARLIQVSEDIQLLTHVAAHTLECNQERIPLTTLLRESIAQAQSPIPSDPPCEITTHIPTAFPPVWCDHRMTRRALAAIVENALRFSPRGAAIRVEVSRRGERAIIAVRDAGPGVAPAEAEHIFEPLYSGARRRTNVGVGLGIGLGLAVARVCVEAQGGDIALARTDTPGATFVVRLPLTSPQT